MTARMETRLARLEAVQAGRGGVHVFKEPRNLMGEALTRWKAEATAGISHGAMVVMVQMRNAGVTP